MDVGQVLHVIATDPGSIKDLEAFCKQTGNEMVGSSEDGEKYYFFIKKT